MCDPKHSAFPQKKKEYLVYCTGPVKTDNRKKESPMVEYNKLP